ncbi:hypothetical protein AVEN_198499-1 [Araneus ventricosus]|uniref:Uncharacterized protein n=1 Tax=Araneus ventricosus TaxID=182803 RepID=A0A4Y2RIW9_ARAVE|nr:hypothetical protein AVEN_198499-1 [Araneus ventricosus]
MAENGNGRYRAINEFSDGRNVFYIFSARQSMPFMQDYNIKCHVLPTSWIFQFHFHHLPDSDIVSRSIILRRKDSMKCPVNVLIWVSYFDDIHRHPIYSETFDRDKMLPGDELQVYLAEILSLSRMKILNYDRITVKGSVSIRYCHSENDAHHETWISI